MIENNTHRVITSTNKAVALMTPGLSMRPRPKPHRLIRQDPKLDPLYKPRQKLRSNESCRVFLHIDWQERRNRRHDSKVQRECCQHRNAKKKPGGTVKKATSGERMGCSTE